MDIAEARLSKDEVLHLFSLSGMGTNPVMSEEDYATKLSEKAYFLLAKEDNVVIGFCAFYKNLEGKFLYISLLWVDEKNRSKGIGHKILEYFKIFDIILFKTINLEVLKENNRALSFYQKIGFSIYEDRGERFYLILQRK